MLKSLALLMCCLVYIAINGTSAVNQANLTSPTESPSPVSLNTSHAINGRVEHWLLP